MSAATLRSWGNHPPHPQVTETVAWRDEIEGRLAEVRARAGTTLACGAGRSYGDSCLAASDRLLDLQPLDRFIAADWSAGVVRVEAGVTLAQVLAVAIPRGWFLAVTPGTRHVTVGGAIANDVHGKNHHRRGTFGCHVRGIGLVRSDCGRLECGPDAQADLFRATIGGLGLTGVIEWAEFALRPITSSTIDAVTVRFERLDEFFALADEFDLRHEFSVAWVDCAARGTATGRGIFSAGDFASDGPLTVAKPSRLAMPCNLPVSLVNRASVRAFNTLYWRSSSPGRLRRRVDHAPFFYPLDGIAHWNRIYGRRGFQQYQAVIPTAHERDAVRALLAAVARDGRGSFLAVLKRCGDVASPGVLSFPLPGTTLALDFPHDDTLDDELFPRLDAIVREAGGRLYPAKDAHLSGADFRAAYPAWAQVEALRDPALLSRFWQRVTA